jgi:hypothetical protein
MCLWGIRMQRSGREFLICWGPKVKNFKYKLGSLWEIKGRGNHESGSGYSRQCREER